jgi:hypothetical protein
VLTTTRRDEHLLALAQDAALNDQREIVLSKEDIQALALDRPDQVPAHVELCFTVLSTYLKDPILDRPDRGDDHRVYDLSTLTAGAVRGQVSSPPLRLPTYNVARAPAHASGVRCSSVSFV